MKRVGNLYESIISIENLKLADKRARRGKQKQHGVQRHLKNEEENILSLHNVLKERRYKTSEYSIFEIEKPKKRIISRLPYFPDRILHHALCAIVNPIIIKSFIEDTYSGVKGKGVHKASLRLRRFLKDKENTKYCCKIDVQQFYPSISHDILKGLIRRKIKDPDVLNLIDELINSSPGLPLGNMASQILSNLYLSYFDHYVKEVLKVKYFLRFADDMIFLGKNTEELREVFIKVQEYLRDNLELEIKENYQIFPVESRGIDWCGFVHFHTHTALRKSIKLNYIKAVKNNKVNSLPSYGGWLKYSNSINLKRKYQNEIIK